MSALLRRSLIIICLTVLAAAFGGWAGVRYGLQKARQPTQLDQILHDNLKLTAAQQLQIEALERAFAMRRNSSEAAMRAANAQLATALTVRHAYDADAKQAVDAFHQAMLALQEATIEHVLAMRAALTPQQAEQFDRTVVKALAAEGP